MPADGMTTINVQVEVATIWPFHHAVDATRRHHLRHEVHHPRWKWRWRHLKGTVVVLALAAWPYQPRCLSRHGPLVTFRLQPLHRAVNQSKIHVALLGCPNAWKVTSKASSFVVQNRVLPSLRGPVLDQRQADLLPGKFPPLAEEFVGNCRASLFVFLLRLLFLFLLLFFLLLPSLSLSLILSCFSSFSHRLRYGRRWRRLNCLLQYFVLLPALCLLRRYFFSRHLRSLLSCLGRSVLPFLARLHLFYLLLVSLNLCTSLFQALTQVSEFFCHLVVFFIHLLCILVQLRNALAQLQAFPPFCTELDPQHLQFLFTQLARYLCVLLLQVVALHLFLELLPPHMAIK
mmetsp:Transcript_24495/g.53422  ORF Transcript_24495/g.53422 Transcript_24495/m.53422 type:complete len:345 (+) Transcript_24495:404-1438(+)